MRQLHSTFSALDICILHMHFFTFNILVFLCSVCEQMSKVTTSERKVGDGKQRVPQGHLTGVTVRADWLIPCSLSHPTML